jgi:DNA-binding transcriptional ArsR family regulator
MSPSSRNSRAVQRGAAQRSHAVVFAALGDTTRLAIVARLADGEPCSIVELTDGSQLTRQAVTKHLRVLEDVGLVRGVRAGRENLFELDPKPLAAAKSYLESVSQQWDETLARLKAFVER